MDMCPHMDFYVHLARQIDMPHLDLNTKWTQQNQMDSCVHLVHRMDIAIWT